VQALGGRPKRYAGWSSWGGTWHTLHRLREHFDRASSSYDYFLEVYKRIPIQPRANTLTVLQPSRPSPGLQEAGRVRHPVPRVAPLVASAVAPLAVAARPTAHECTAATTQ